MREQRERGQASARRGGFAGAEALPPTRFIGYDLLETEATVLRIGLDREIAALAAGEQRVRAPRCLALLRGGGRPGRRHRGRSTGPAAAPLVRDTQPVAGSDARAHDVLVQTGELRAGQQVHAEVDADRARRGSPAITAQRTCSIARCARCSATASCNAARSWARTTPPSTSRSPGRSPRTELTDIEHRVNDGIRRNLERTVALMPLADARASGAIALIDEAYSPDVRVVDFGGWSRELCGGTHVTRSGDLGAAIIVSESSIGQGIRRIEMVSGESAEERWRRIGAALQTTARALKTRPEEVPERVAALQEQVRKLDPRGHAGAPGSALERCDRRRHRRGRRRRPFRASPARRRRRR